MSKKRKINLSERATTALLISGVAACVILCGSETVFKRTLTIDSIFAGMLALTGFLFTARTFVTFKLHESVYGDEKYRRNWKQMKDEGGFRDEKKLYDPLKKFDKKVGEATRFCFLNLLVILVFSFIPSWFGKAGISITDAWTSASTWYEGLSNHWMEVIYELLSGVVLSGIVLVIVHSFYAFLSINRNIQRIIQLWENEYENPPKD